MIIVRNFTLSLLLLACVIPSTLAQDRADERPAAPTPTVTISAAAKGLRVAALGNIRQIRLEVFGEGGSPVYNSGFKVGNVFDWTLEDAHGEVLPDGTYLCVVTLADVSGRVGTRQGSVLVQSGRAALKLSEAELSAASGQDKAIAAANDVAGAVVLAAHDGNDGQVVSTHGGLSFRAGDFFAGRDKELMHLTPGGDLGLGVTAPKAKLDVAGVIRARGGIQFEDGTVLTSARNAAKPPPGNALTAAAGETTTANVTGTGTTSRLPKWLDAAGTLGDSAILETNGMTVFGRSTPLLPNASDFHLVEMAAPGTKTPLVLVGGSGAMEFWKDTALSGGLPSGGMSIGMAVPGTPATNDIIFTTYDPNVGFTERFRVAKGGNVGIGVSAPAARLDVAGSIRISGDAVVSGNIAAKYQDVAEWVPARQFMAPGTVVILDAKRANSVAPSRCAYDTHVAGVVSAQPGVILGEGGEGKVMVATTGRVKVKVDARRRPVRIGDLLVTSGKAGVAMRSLPVRAGGARIHRPGTIIGKALEPLAKGEGEILVLLSLQ